MAIANEQLKQIFDDLQATFKNDKYIKIVPAGGDPPEKYEIQYSIHGIVQDKEGNIKKSKKHSILISIPFGFPHFPPSCIPQSPTYHPDFDQAAICIGDFWNKDKSLSELIIHICQMISGEKFSSENAFNDSAVAWYKMNNDRLPFEKYTPSADIATATKAQPTPQKSTSPAAPAPTAPQEQVTQALNDEVAPQSIDTLDESDFSAELDYLDAQGKQNEAADPNFPATAQDKDKGTLNTVRQLVRQKRYYELSTFFSNLSADDLFDDREEIETKVDDILSRAMTYQRQADDNEDQGDNDKSFTLLKKIADLVPDFPNIEENITRIKNACDLDDEWMKSREAPESARSSRSIDRDSAKGKKRVAFFAEKKKSSANMIPILAISIAVILVIAVSIPYFSASSRIKDAEKFEAECSNLLDDNAFEPAQRSCESGLSLLGEVTFFKKKRQTALISQIKGILESEKMQEGLLGRVLFDGEYVHKNRKEIVLKFNNLREEADANFEDKEWRMASDKYSSALRTAKPVMKSLEQAVLRNIVEKQSISQINILVERGEQLFDNGELDKSSELYLQAVGKAKNLTDTTQDEYLALLEPKIAEIEYMQLLDLGEKFFVSNDWESAVQQYQKAMKLRSESSLGSKYNTSESLNTKMAEAELYSLISRGKDSFSQSDWKNAIDHYKKAIKLLDQKKNLLKRINPANIKKELRRLILRANIVQNKQDADTSMEKGQYKKAIQSLQTVLKVVEKSGFKKEEEFRSIITGTKKSMTQARRDAALSNKIAYLVRNYKKIFQEHYAAAVPQYMKDPKATFIKNIGKKQLFELQCLESGQGRKLKLVIHYIYDPSTKKWAFYSKTE